MFSRKASNCLLCPTHMETPVPVLQQTKDHRALNAANISEQSRFPTQRCSPPRSDYRALFVAEMRAKQLQFFERKTGLKTIYKRLFVVIYHTCLFLCME